MNTNKMHISCKPCCCTPWKCWAMWLTSPKIFPINFDGAVPGVFINKVTPLVVYLVCIYLFTSIHIKHYVTTKKFNFHFCQHFLVKCLLMLSNLFFFQTYITFIEKQCFAVIHFKRCTNNFLNLVKCFLLYTPIKAFILIVLYTQHSIYNIYQH